MTYVLNNSTPLTQGFIITAAAPTVQMYFLFQLSPKKSRIFQKSFDVFPKLVKASLRIFGNVLFFGVYKAILE